MTVKGYDSTPRASVRGDNPPKRLPRKSEDDGPYRKPTQVVEESILRRSSDSWLRN